MDFPIPVEIQQLAHIQELIFSDALDELYLLEEINKISKSIPNLDQIISYFLSTAANLRFREKDFYNNLLKKLNLKLINIENGIHFLINPIILSIIQDAPEMLTSYF